MVKKRIFDLLLVLVGCMALAVPMLLVFIAVRLTSPGPALYWSVRVGRNNQTFSMPKFRSMCVRTPLAASRDLQNPENYITRVGSFLRKSSIDELPQLWSIFRGDMSFVGPRPVILQETDLTELRTLHNVHTLQPGLTGWAQVNGRDALSVPEKVKLDAEYLQRKSLAFDAHIIWLTFLIVLKRAGISH